MGLNYEKEGHIVKARINRPKGRNALDPQILMDLHHAWKEINADDAIFQILKSGLGIMPTGRSNGDERS